MDFLILAFELLEHGRAANQSPGVVVERAVDFTGKSTIGETHSELVGVDEACANNLDDGAASAWSTLWFYLENADG